MASRADGVLKNSENLSRKLGSFGTCKDSDADSVHAGSYSVYGHHDGLGWQ